MKQLLLCLLLCSLACFVRGGLLASLQRALLKPFSFLTTRRPTSNTTALLWESAVEIDVLKEQVANLKEKSRVDRKEFLLLRSHLVERTTAHETAVLVLKSENAQQLETLRKNLTEEFQAKKADFQKAAVEKLESELVRWKMQFLKTNETKELMRKEHEAAMARLKVEHENRLSSLSRELREEQVAHNATRAEFKAALQKTAEKVKQDVVEDSRRKSSNHGSGQRDATPEEKKKKVLSSDPPENARLPRDPTNRAAKMPPLASFHKRQTASLPTNNGSNKGRSKPRT